MFSLLHHSRSFLCSPIIHLFTQAVPNIRLFSLSLFHIFFSICHQSRALTLFSRSEGPFQTFLTAWVLLISLRSVFNAAPWRRVHTRPRTVHRWESFICSFSTIQSAPVGRLSDNQRVLPLVLLSGGGFDPLRRLFKGIFHTKVGSCGWKRKEPEGRFFLKAC